MQLNNRPTHEMAIVLLGTAGAAIGFITHARCSSVPLQEQRSLLHASYACHACAETDNLLNTEMAEGGDEGQVIRIPDYAATRLSGDDAETCPSRCVSTL